MPKNFGNYLSIILLFFHYSTSLGATNNDAMNNRSILNGGVRARMRLHSSENLAPSACRGLTNIHLSPNYNGGSSQTNSNKSIGSSAAISNADGTSSNIGSSSSLSSLSTGTLVNGHAIPMADKSMVSPGNRHAADIRTFTNRLTFKEQSSTSTNSTDSRAYTRSNYGSTEQSAMLKSDPRGVSRPEQILVNTGQICTDVRGISRQDQSTLSGADNSQADSSVSSDTRSALRVEQPIIATLADGRVIARSLEPSTSILLTDDSRGMRQSDQSTSIRVTGEDLRAIRQSEQSTTSIRVSEDLRNMRQSSEQIASIRVNEDLRTMRQQPEQSTNIRMTDDLRGIRQSEQSTSVRGGDDLRASRQQPEQSSNIRLQEDLRLPRTEQSINPPIPDLRGVPRTQGTNISVIENRIAVSRSAEQSGTVIPLTDGRAVPIAEHMSPAASLSDHRSGMSRLPQTSLSNQPISVAGQSSAQPNPSVLLTEDVNHSEEPLPPGWEMRYDLYGRR